MQGRILEFSLERGYLAFQSLFGFAPPRGVARGGRGGYMSPGAEVGAAPK